MTKNVNVNVNVNVNRGTLACKMSWREEGLLGTQELRSRVGTRSENQKMEIEGRLDYYYY